LSSFRIAYFKKIVFFPAVKAEGLAVSKQPFIVFSFARPKKDQRKQCPFAIRYLEFSTPFGIFVFWEVKGSLKGKHVENLSRIRWRV